MERCLCNLAYLRRLLKTASKHGTWWDRFWSDELMRLVIKTKADNHAEFVRLYESCYVKGLPLCFLLKQGYVSGLRALVCEKMDFSTPGRSVACLAFLCVVCDDISDGQFSLDYVLDSIAIPVWQQSRYRAATSDVPGGGLASESM